MTNEIAEMKKKVAAAIFDPGNTEGYKGERTLTEWQTDAVMRVLALSTPAPAVVKALEWREVDHDWFAADTEFGLGYEVRISNRGNVRVRSERSGWEDFVGAVDEAKAFHQADYEQRIRSALATPDDGWLPTHRHKKRGSTYSLVGVGRMQAENWEVREYGATDEPSAGPSVDMHEVAIYRSTDDGSLWVRPIEEFTDGRFEVLPAPPANGRGE